jgi:hypothetical protein
MRSAARTPVLMSTLLALCLAPAATATAQTADYPPDEGGLEVSRTSLSAGDTLKATASGFCAKRDVGISLVSETAPTGARSAVHPSSTPADGDGDVSVSVTIPRSTEPGDYELRLRGLGSDCSQVKSVSSRIEVLGARRTGGSGGDPGTRGEGPGPNAPGQPDVAAAPGGAAADALPSSGNGGEEGSTGLAFTGLNLILLLGAGLALLTGGALLRSRSAVSRR